MITRDNILDKAYHDCMKEMYAKSQPSVDYDQLLEDVKNGLIGKDERVYEHYYLSQEEFLYIRDKYMKAYRIEEQWNSNIELLEEYLTNGGTKDKYIKAHTDEYGYHPGYRGYEKVAPIKEQFDIILNEYNLYDENMLNKLYDTIMNTISNCKNFYRFDRELNSFSASIALGASPTSNKNTVIKYWKEHGKDIEIIEHNPLLFWDIDYYGDKFKEVMIDEYGENWEEYWDKKWKDEIAKKEAERKKQISKLLNNE